MSDRGIALVTGASSGIGESITEQLAARKFELVLGARRKDRLEVLAERLRKEHGVEVHVVQVDLATSGGARDLLAVAEQIGPIEVLVNNAGFGVYGTMADQSVDRTLEMVELNVGSLTYLTHHVVKGMVKRGSGRVLQIASIGAFQPTPFYAVYSATKSFVLSFSEALHYELAGTGVTVTTSCPGLTATEFHDVAEHPKPAWMRSITMSADEVAKVSLDAMFAGERTVVPGFVNWLTATTVKFLPKRLVVAMAAASMRRAG
jgi:short-subunit dehydrogenase